MKKLLATLVLSLILAQAFATLPNLIPARADPIASDMSPNDLRQAYGTYNAIQSGWTGTGVTIGIVDAYGDPTIVNDVNAFDNLLGYSLPSVDLTISGTSGTNSPWAEETALDVEWAHAMAPGAKIILQLSPDAYSWNLFGAVNSLVSLANPPNIISISWGGSGLLQGGVYILDTFDPLLYSGIFSTAASKGIKVYASTGDTGAYNGSPFLNVNYPASDPNVIAVGGTVPYYNTVGGTREYYEYGWSDSGGGYTGPLGFGEPAYQSNAGIPDPSGKRAIPDVSLEAYPGVEVYDGGSLLTGVSGTSLSAPLMAGIAAVALNGGWNLDNNALYSLYPSNAKYEAAFHDVYLACSPSANNGYYDVQNGWDAVTGLGSINLENFISASSYQSGSVTLTAQSLSPSSITAGQSFSLTYTINNPSPNPLTQIGLGASIRLHGSTTVTSDPSNDIYVSVPSGTSTQSRQFLTTSSLTPGSYDVLWGVWMGPPGQGNQLLSSGWQVNQLRVGRSGGPDGFGYSFVDSNSLNGPAYNWIEIATPLSGTGTEVLPSSDDQWVGNIGLGFFFNYYGTDYSQLAIGNNGILFSGSGTSQYVNDPITQSPTIHGFIAPYWDDLVTWGSAGAVYYQTLGTAPNRIFVVEWYDNQHYTSSTSGVTFETILYEGSNNILFQYKNVDFGTVSGSTGGDLPPYNNGGSATVGIEDPTGSIGLQYSFNEQVITPGLAILFKFPTFAGTNMHLSMNAPVSMDHGNTLTYSFYYNDLGDVAAPNVVLQAMLSANLNFVSASDSGIYDSGTRTVTWNLGTVPAFPAGRGSTTISATIPTSVQVGTVIQTTSSISTTILETRYDDNSASAQTTVTGSNLPPNVGVGPTLGNTGGTPSVYWGTAITFTYHDATATGVDIRIHLTDGGPDIVGSMTGGPPDWTYTVTFYPRHGQATVTYTVHGPIPHPVIFNIYVDPAGYVYDVNTLARVAGASVWLQVPDGQGGWVNASTGLSPPIMQPDTNPLVTGTDGQFQWDVLAGTYRLHVEAPGYYSADSIVVTVPPPVTDLHIGLTPLPVTQYQITFDQTSVGSDFTGTVVSIDGINYAVSDLPKVFQWDNGTSHNFIFQSPLVVGSAAKEYDWTSTNGLSVLQSDSITVTSTGNVTGNYVTHVNDVAVTNVAADRTWVYQGFIANINVTVLNKGDSDENVTVTLYCNITANQIIGAQNVTLSPGQNQTLDFWWDTTSVPYCHNYTMTAVAAIPSDDNLTDNTLGGGPVRVRILGDMNGDGKVDILDSVEFANYFGLHKGDARWNADADMNRDGIMNVLDAILIAEHFGISGPS